jgi:hypothetical protein
MDGTLQFCWGLYNLRVFMDFSGSTRLFFGKQRSKAVPITARKQPPRICDFFYSSPFKGQIDLLVFF